MWARLYFVARRLVSAHHVRSLGLQLGVADYTIDTALYNHRYDIQEAGYTVLKAFIQGQESRTKAYARLQGALTHSSVGLDQMTGRVLNSPVTDVIQGKVDFLYNFIVIMIHVDSLYFQNRFCLFCYCRF